jgi:hypothetical protein
MQSNSTFGQPHNGFAQTDKLIFQLLPAPGPCLSCITPFLAAGSYSNTDDCIFNRAFLLKTCGLLLFPQLFHRSRALVATNNSNPHGLANGRSRFRPADERAPAGTAVANKAYTSFYVPATGSAASLATTL